MTQVIGRGSNGVVARRPGTEYVIKACAAGTDRDTASIIREVGLLRYLAATPQVARLLGVGRGAITLQYGGISLRDYLVSRGPCRDAELLGRLAGGIVASVATLHGCGIAHRDIKPENILLAGSSDAPQIRLCDFGVSQRIGCRVLAQRGAALYCAPELEETGRCADLLAADIWAVGCVLRELAGELEMVAADLCCATDPALRPRAAELAAALGVAVPAARTVMHWYVRPACAFSAAAVAARAERYAAISSGGISVRAFCLAASIVDAIAYGEVVGDLVQAGPLCSRAAMAAMPSVAAYVAEIYLGERVSSVVAPPQVDAKLVWKVLAVVHLEQLLVCDMGLGTVAECSRALLRPELACKRSEDAYGLFVKSESGLE